MSPTLFIAQHGSGFEDQFGAIICSKIDVWLDWKCVVIIEPGEDRWPWPLTMETRWAVVVRREWVCILHISIVLYCVVFYRTATGIPGQYGASPLFPRYGRHQVGSLARSSVPHTTTTTTLSPHGLTSLTRHFHSFKVSFGRYIVIWSNITVLFITI